MVESGLNGRRVLVVEDESRIAMLIRDTLEDLGCEVVAVAARFDVAREQSRTLEFDIALLDVNLDGEPSFPIAQELAQRGVPFVLATGYGTSKIPADLQRAPILQKPFMRADLERALCAALAK